MAREIIMPRLSDSMEEGTILQWLVAEGDHVEAGQPLVEVETDKANVTHEADEAGTILALSVREGASVPVGAPIAVLGEPEEELPGAPAPETLAAAGAPDASGPAAAPLPAGSAPPPPDRRPPPPPHRWPPAPHRRPLRRRRPPRPHPRAEAAPRRRLWPAAWPPSLGSIWLCSRAAGRAAA